MSSIYQNILHLFFSGYFEILSQKEQKRIAPNSVLQRIRLLVRIFANRLKQLNRSSYGEHEEKALFGKTWLFISSRNNLDALSFLKDDLEDTVFVSDKKRDFLTVSNEIFSLNFRYQALYFYKFLPLAIALLRKKGILTLRLLSVIGSAIGSYEEWIRLLKKISPKAIVFANDHNICCRSLLLAAKKVGVPTIYIQHASVSQYFPPLTFDLNLLEGRDAFEKYRRIGMAKDITVALIGMPKFDAYRNYRKQLFRLKNIGIPFNLNDDFTLVLELANYLADHFPQCQINLRSHPKDKKHYSSDHEKITFSDTQKENSFDFLKKQDVIIAGNTSIHLEAVLLNIPAIYFYMSPGQFVDDYYGYYKNGLVPKASSNSEVLFLINSIPEKLDVYKKAEYYNVAFDTDQGGRLNAIKAIKEYLQKDKQ